MFCEQCGTKMVEGAAFCYKCGAPAHVEEPEPEDILQPAPQQAAPQEPAPQPAPQQPAPQQATPQEPASQPAPQQESEPQPVQQQPTPQQVSEPPHQPQYQQNTYYNTQQGYYQQRSPFNNPETTISNARTLGILAIVGAFTITLGGLICGIIGLLKVKDLKVPPQLEAQKNSAKKLNVIGICIAVGFTILAFILIGVAGCSAAAYY